MRVDDDRGIRKTRGLRVGKPNKECVKSLIINTLVIFKGFLTETVENAVPKRHGLLNKQTKSQYQSWGLSLCVIGQVGLSGLQNNNWLPTTKTSHTLVIRQRNQFPTDLETSSMAGSLWLYWKVLWRSLIEKRHWLPWTLHITIETY